MRLNRTEPYDQIFGVPGVSFQQAGNMFNQAGQLVVDGVSVVDADDLLEELSAEAAESTSDDDEAVPLEKRSWKALKALIEAYGGEYTTKEAAIAYLAQRG